MEIKKQTPVLDYQFAKVSNVEGRVEEIVF